jgi:hypothetical protein
MAFITHCWRKVSTLIALMLFCISVVHADIRPELVEAKYLDDVMQVNLRYKVNINKTLQDALSNGVALPFAFEVEILKPRLYSLYRDMFSSDIRKDYRLSYHALTRQYRVTQGSYFRSFTTLDEALSALGILRNWRLLEGYITQGNYKDVRARVRMRLDVSQLPKPYQITTIGNEQWTMESGWTEFQPRVDEGRS